MQVEIINGDCWEWLRQANYTWDCIFADPPDNLGLVYDGCLDKLDPHVYLHKLHDWLLMFLWRANSVWFSFNARYTAEVGHFVYDWKRCRLLDGWTFQPCIQTFNFGNHNPRGLTNCHRPLWLFHKGTLEPKNAMVPSVRGRMGDKRALEDGLKTPGDVFDFCRVQGNNRQRRKYHPTQLHGGLVERCIKLTTKEGDHVLDPFAGTGTTARVCLRINRRCTLIEQSAKYCKLIREDLKQ